MTAYTTLQDTLRRHPKTWLVTGVAGFIGSNLLETLLKLDQRVIGFDTIGLRYFNVFGKRQDPAGAYAAVVPKWTAAMIAGEDVFINGDGETSRDFCYIDNAVQANLLAATASGEARNQVYNVAVGERTSLNQLFDHLQHALADNNIRYDKAPIHRDFRAGDVRHSQADVSKAARLLGYAPAFDIKTGIEVAMPWYIAFP